MENPKHNHDLCPSENLVDQCAKRNVPDLYERLVEIGDVKVCQKQVKSAIQTLETKSFEEVKELMQSMIADIEANVSILRQRVREVRQLNQNDIPCIDKDLPYFDYPSEKFTEPFKGEITRVLQQGRIPDIGIIGYGSLQSALSSDSTLYDPYTRESVVTYDLQRGLFMRHYSTHATRKDAFWAKTGATHHDETGSMAVRYKKDQIMNGVRLSNLSLQDIKHLMQREFPYFLLPCGSSYNDFGERKALNLICWPIGNYLTKTIKAEQWKNFINMPIFRREGNDKESLYDMHMFRSAHSLHYYGLKPDMHYVETCLDRGDAKHENLFLDTTFVPMSQNEPLALREYLEKHAPANDETKREYFGPRLKKRRYLWDEERQQWILKKEFSVKTTQRYSR